MPAQHVGGIRQSCRLEEAKKSALVGGGVGGCGKKMHMVFQYIFNGDINLLNKNILENEDGCRGQLKT